MYLDEELLGQRARAYSSHYTAASARIVLWCMRISFPIVLAAFWFVPALVDATSIQPPAQPPLWSVILALIALVLAIGLLYLISDLLFTGITWSRFSIGGWPGRVMAVLLAVAIAGFVMYELVAIVAAFRDGNGPLGWTLIAIIVVVFVTQGVPALIAPRAWSAWLPGYGHLPLIDEERVRTLSRYRHQLEAVLLTNATDNGETSTSAPQSKR